MINGNVLYISGALKDSNDAFYEINFYKAVSEVVLKANDKHIGISSALCEMLAEKIHNMDTNGSRIIMPRTVEEQVGNDKIELRAGYINYNLIISLAKQLFISMNLNENKIINRMFFEGFDIVLNDTFNDKNSMLLLEVLDKICIMYINRKVKGMINPNEKSLMDKYQIIINDSFTKLDQNYFAFCALITTDELRKKCMEKLNKK